MKSIDSNLPVKQDNNRDDLGRFKEGKSGNLKGRPKGSIMKMIEELFDEVALKRGKSLLRHIVERAYVSDKVAIALFNKLIPNAQPKDIEERDEVKIIIERAYSEEEQRCLNEVFEDWKKKKIR